MSSPISLLVVPVKDLARAKALYAQLLGVAPYADEPYYVGFRVGEQEIGLDPNGHARGLTSAVPYWPVDDVRASLRQLLEAGAAQCQDVSEVGGGKLIAIVADPDGQPIGLVQSP